MKNYFRSISILKKRSVFSNFTLKKKRKFFRRIQENLSSFISRLHTHNEIPVQGAAKSRLGQRLVSMFTAPIKTTGNADDTNSTKTSFILPAGKEYILRSSIARPSPPRSRPSPQRMYCLLASDEFRLCGAFSEDTTFF